ncbi:hypothetical protein L228DRAFT_57071 [Xylona heveae TC161]|uniref:Chromatin modification-related protein n=1 Tax=Xylona heveae (strain CBS 132557 / TC161) TaxID=1328760 RepID=A0A165IG47_XYLHT|nr:hypothetical protein L228DRAFT_57071 [Xylona heveae TC161]KZF24850.1 hypothetical protein L228DRAFT_57071 [Xylona heveae TC161]
MSTIAPPSTNRRQSVRQTRANPARANLPRPYGRRVSLGENEPQRPTGPPGFFPAMTHFTDTITALPKEIVRHFTLLKEVDAKAYGPEETLHQLSEVALSTPLPPRQAPEAQSGAEEGSSAAPGGTVTPGANGATGPTSGPTSAPQQEEQQQSMDNQADIARRRVFFNLRYLITEMLLTLDEKNHVIATATEALNKQLQRMESSYPYIDNEISEEARCGSLSHWAYADRANAKSHPPPAERSRRDVASANNLAAAAAALHEREAAASRSESRREAMLARKQRNQHADSDFDDRRKGPGGAKVRRTAADAADGKGLTVDTLGAAQPPKRRRTDKGVGAAAMERSLSQALNGGSGKGGLGSPRATPDPTKKRTKTTTGQTRKRNTGASGARSPSVASSPVQPSFPGGRDFPIIGGASQRPQSSRARQNSAQSVQQDGPNTGARNRPSSSASNRPGTSNGIPPSTPELNNVAGLTGRSLADVKGSMKETITSKGEHVIEEEGHEREPDHLKGALVMGAGGVRNAGKDSGVSEDRVAADLKREDTESNGDYNNNHHATRGVDHTGFIIGNGLSSAQTNASTSGTTRTERANGSHANNGGNGGAGRTSKTSTPIVANFPDPPTFAAGGASSSSATHHRSSRPSRTSESGASGAAPVKRSHKKGGSAAAAAAAAQQAHHLGTAGSPRLGHSTGAGARGGGAINTAALEEEDEVDDDAEPRYCYCNQVSYGEMVACDADDCPREWFHLDCVGLSKAPTKNAKWYCDECKENLKRNKGVSSGR